MAARKLCSALTFVLPSGVKIPRPWWVLTAHISHTFPFVVVRLENQKQPWWWRESHNLPAGSVTVYREECSAVPGYHDDTERPPGYSFRLSLSSRVLEVRFRSSKWKGWKICPLGLCSAVPWWRSWSWQAKTWPSVVHGAILPSGPAAQSSVNRPAQRHSG